MLDAKTVKKIAKLACIEVSESEIASYATELSKILSLAEELQSVNTDGVPQMTGTASNQLRWREDKVTDGNIREDVLKNAPRAEYGCFLVPKVIE
jgi:aspartyl-tRNA(Asn)/glutamyl-tRNA(Gln) amidotransferase subunit C